MPSTRLALAVCSLASCGEIFSRRPCDIKRASKLYCCRRCFALGLTTGRTTAVVPCDGCRVPVERGVSEMRRRKKVFCTLACYRERCDFEALGRSGGSAPHPPLSAAVMAARSRKGGLARARSLSPARRREIAMLGVAARTPADYARAQLTRRAGRGVLFGVRLGRRS